MHEESKCYVYLSWLFVFVLAIFSMCRHDPELVNKPQIRGFLFVGWLCLRNQNVLCILVGYLSLYSANSCMCRHEEELCKQASDLRPFFVGWLCLRNQNVVCI